MEECIPEIFSYAVSTGVLGVFLFGTMTFVQVAAVYSARRRIAR